MKQSDTLVTKENLERFAEEQEMEGEGNEKVGTKKKKYGSELSFKSLGEDDEIKKKILKGFDEKKDFMHMTCKRMHTDLPADIDILEDISD